MFDLGVCPTNKHRHYLGSKIFVSPYNSCWDNNDGDDLLFEAVKVEGY